MINFQRHKDPLQKLLDHAKANIDVIDFRNPDRKVRINQNYHHNGFAHKIVYSQSCK